MITAFLKLWSWTLSPPSPLPTNAFYSSSQAAAAAAKPSTTTTTTTTTSSSSFTDISSVQMVPFAQHNKITLPHGLEKRPSLQ
ncbi:hypothetical protein GJ744_009556 [Endocarpon pusillum]|uniref:Uncharacterized protein n=1 Tax=Endocarpon pusillum TaxID=364733 RepID=A0A8H7AN58_9EURO|nr:hypothetical protein GJ744_009556 [Endocarpon pusillum]